MATLKYNNTVFPGTPVADIKFLDPYISRETNIDYSGEWQTNVDRYIINGTLYIEADGYDGANSSNLLIAGKDQIIQFFRQNYKKLETDLGILETARVRNITFDDSRYSGMLTYTVTLDGPGGVEVSPGTKVFQKVKGVTDEFSFAASEGGFGTLSHRISAQGIDNRNLTGATSNSDALKNAKEWVKARKGLGNIPTWEFVTGLDGSATDTNSADDFTQTKETENINRMSASVEIVEEYIFNRHQLGTAPTALIKYNIDVSDSQTSDAIKVDVTLEAQADVEKYNLANVDWINETHNQIKGGAVDMDTAIRTIAQDNYDSYIIAMKVGVGDGVTTTTGIQKNINPVLNPYKHALKSSNVDKNTGVMTYVFSYDNDLRFQTIAGTNNCLLDYTTDTAIDYITGVTSCTLQGTLLPDPSLDITQKIWNLEFWLNNLYSGAALHTYLHSLVNTEYNILDLGGAGGTLNSEPTSLSVNLNKTKGECTVSASFTDKDAIAGVATANFTINVKPAITPYTPKPSVQKDAHYIVFSPKGERRAEWTAQVMMEGTRDKPVFASTFKNMEQKIINKMNIGGSDLVKIQDTATKAFNVATARNSSIGFSMKQNNFWSISQQIEPQP